MPIEKLIEILQTLPKDTICVDSETGIFYVEKPWDAHLRQYEGCAFSTLRIITPSVKLKPQQVSPCS
jgi:hypothetical protein